MTADGYVAALAALDMTQGAAARLLRVDERTSRRWATDDLPIPHAVAALFYVMIAYRVSPSRVEELAQEFES